jgi:dimethylglycine dehydrogenase
MLSEGGRLAGDFSISCITPERFLLLGADYMQLAFMRHLNHFLPAPGVVFSNLSGAYAGLHICGPNARELISRLAGRDMDNQHFPFMSAAEMPIGLIDKVLVLRVSFTGETGYEMYLPMAQQLALFDLLRVEGANLGLGLVGTRCLMQTRLEKSFPAWALELSSDYTAVEAELDRFVKPDKDDFVGREAFLKAPAPREKFATFTVDAGNCAIWGDEAIFLDNEAVGYVTSGGYGPACEQHIALGYVNCDAYQPGGQYAVEVLGQLVPAELQPEPLYDPSGVKMRA